MVATLDPHTLKHIQARVGEKGTRGFRQFSEIGLDDLTFRVHEHMRAIGLFDLYKREVGTLSANIIQSPLERAMLAFLRIDSYEGNVSLSDVSIILPGDDEPSFAPSDAKIVLYPQKSIGPYYLDIGCHVHVLGEVFKFDIECDGFKYHRSNWAQIEKDSWRDRDVMKLGYFPIRIDGYLITRNPIDAAGLFTSKVGKSIAYELKRKTA